MTIHAHAADPRRNWIYIDDIPFTGVADAMTFYRSVADKLIGDASHTSAEAESYFAAKVKQIRRAAHL